MSTWKVVRKAHEDEDLDKESLSEEFEDRDNQPPLKRIKTDESLKEIK